MPLAGRRGLVIGARGRCGRGAVEALALASLSPTLWDIEETRRLDRDALLAHDFLVNVVGIAGTARPFLRPEDLPGRLALIVDVTCDLGSPANALPVYDRPTSWESPVASLPSGVRLIAIDNLPSLLSQEASAAFSAALVPHLARPGEGPVWGAAADVFYAALGAFTRKEIEHA